MIELLKVLLVHFHFDMMIIFLQFFSMYLQLSDAERRISSVEECDCKKQCVLPNGTVKADGERWDIGCKQCQCLGGQVTCDKRPCEPINCKYPQQPDEALGECCPKCLSKLILYYTADGISF